MMASNSKKVLSIFSLVMINVIAVDSLRTLPISAEYGFTLVFYYLLAAIVFFIPVSLVSAELATGWPKTGGLYIWVREAFDKRWGFVTIWLQWVYNIVWYPTILSFIAVALAYLIDPALANNKAYLMTTVLIFYWAATLINCFGIRVSSWVTTVCAILGTLVPITFIIILSSIWFFSGKPEQLQFTWHQFIPHIRSINNMVFLVAVLFGLVGMEMSAVHAGDVKNPQRDYPRALFFSAIIILGTLTLGSLAIAMVVPHAQLSLVSGLLDAFNIFFEAYHMSWMKPVIDVCIIIGALGSVSAWIIGPTRGLLIAINDCNIMPRLQKVNRYQAPANILILQATIFTVLCSLFLLMPTVNSFYWVLSALTGQLALLVYVFMFAAFVKLRYRHPDVERAYRIPLGKLGMWSVAGIGTLTCLGAIVIGFFPPAQINIGNRFVYESILIVGIVVLASVPWFLSRRP